MTLITSIAPIPLMTKPHHDRSIILSFTNLETSDLATHASKNFKASNKKTHTSPQKHEPEERATKRTTKRTNQKNEPRKARPKSTSPKARTQPRCFKPASQPRCLQARLSKPQSTASAPNRLLAPQNAILPLS